MIKKLWLLPLLVANSALHSSNDSQSGFTRKALTTFVGFVGQELSSQIPKKDLFLLSSSVAICKYLPIVLLPGVDYLLCKYDCYQQNKKLVAYLEEQNREDTRRILERVAQQEQELQRPTANRGQSLKNYLNQQRAAAKTPSLATSA